MPVRTLLAAGLVLSGLAVASDSDSPRLQPRIAWYGTLKSGLAEAERSNRAILLVSAAPHCTGVPGIW